MEKTGNKSDSMEMDRDEKTQVLQGKILLNYLPMLNVSFYRPSSGKVSYYQKRKKLFLRHSVSNCGILSQIFVT